MQHQELRIELGLGCSSSLTGGDLNGQAESVVVEEFDSNAGDVNPTQNWSMELLQQVAEHGSRLKTKCPTRPRAIDANEQCKPLGRKILRVLRHVPEEVFLEMEPDGWVYAEHLGDLINQWCSCSTRWKTSTLLSLMQELGISDRVQFDRQWVRAAYGHSTQCYQPTTYADPAESLFHGTSASDWQMIECFGLLPMGRRFVQLTTDFDYATAVATTSNAPVVLQVLRAQALADGVRFVKTESHVWLAEKIPASRLQVWLPDSSDSDSVGEPFRETVHITLEKKNARSR
ncbi:MAG: RNA 2'-phosphotransferase [Pirellulaceae bacterium]|nr:RNA 2'-phosphotransferase [Pirellulaceae bacterium]